MNSIMSDYYPVFKMYQELRDELMDTLNDEDLRFCVEGENPSLGSLCRQIGEVEHAYIQSFKTFKLDFSYRNEDPGLENSVERLTTWFEQLDSELLARIEGFSEDEVHSHTIDRGDDFIVPLLIQLDIYKEALLIFYAKVSVYLKALGKTPSKRWRGWID